MKTITVVVLSLVSFATGCVAAYMLSNNKQRRASHRLKLINRANVAKQRVTHYAKELFATSRPDDQVS